MKKSLIALAVASAMATPAFAATSNVDIYGMFDMSVNSVDTDSNVAGADDRLGGVSSNNTRFGLKGAEDLGGGLKGIWQFENRLVLDGDGSGAFAGGGLRTSYLGLAGTAWGSVKLGNLDTPYKMATGRLDMFPDSYGDYNTIIGSIGGVPAAGPVAAVSGYNTFNVRQPSSVLYETPSFSGLSFAAMYGFRNEQANNLGNGAADDQKLYSLAGMYANGPLFVSLSYENQKSVTPTGSSTPLGDRHGMKLGAGYAFGNLMLSGVYERLSADSGPLDSSDRNAWMLGAGYTMGNIVLKGQYAKAGESDAALGNDGASYYVVGADYVLSKRTKIYATYATLNNDSNAAYAFGGSNSDAFVPAALGNDPNAISLGVRHTF